MSGSIELEISSRTTSPKRRRRSSSSTARRRSSASSETVKSASRETRSSRRRISIREQLVEVSGDDRLERTNVLPMGTKRGSTSFGTFTRANVSVPETGSRSHTASDSDRLEM